MDQATILRQNAFAFSKSPSPLIAAYAEERSKALSIARPERGLSIGGNGFAGDCTTVDASCMAGHGRAVTSLPPQPCPVQPPRCDCQVIGGNTLGGNQLGVATIQARFGTVTLDSGDASYFVPYYMFVQAFPVGQTPDTSTAAGAVPVLLQNSRSGREPNLRRASEDDPSFGIMCTVYADQKQIECVDWRRFASVNNQQLSLVFYNPNDDEIHVFVDIWGIPAA